MLPITMCQSLWDLLTRLVGSSSPDPEAFSSMQSEVDVVGPGSQVCCCIGLVEPGGPRTPRLTPSLF